MTAIRFRHKIGNSGDWNADTAVSHELDPADRGYTLCGRSIGQRLESGGPWEISKWSGVSCRQCLRKLLAAKR